MTIQRFPLTLLGNVLCCVGMLGALAASAEDKIVRDDAHAMTGAMPTLQRGLGAPLNDSKLADMRGGAEVINVQDETARLSNVSASRLTTGSNSISSGSFANSNGLPIVIQNSGNGVIIQNSTILNLNLQ